MNDLIDIKIQHLNGSYVQSVSAKELYLGLGMDKSNWSKWYKKNILPNKFFIENKDWVTLVQSTNGNETNDYIVSIDFAKHLSMMSDTDKAHDYRNYFINCETALKELSAQLNAKTMYRQIAREEAYPMIEAWDNCARENGVSISSYDHSSEFDMLNIIALGITAQGYKVKNNIPLHQSSIRDYLSPVELEAIAFLQNANTLMMDEGVYERYSRKERLQKLFDKKFKLKIQSEVLRLNS